MRRTSEDEAALILAGASDSGKFRHALSSLFPGACPIGQALRPAVITETADSEVNSRSQDAESATEVVTFVVSVGGVAVAA